MPVIEVLPTTEITVAYINPPKEGKKMGSVKTADGQFYNVFENMLAQFSKGMKCRVEYEARPKDGGGEWRTIKKIVGNGSAPTPGPKNDYRARSNPAEAKQIAVLAIVKEWVPQIAVADTAALIDAIRSAMMAYDQTLGGVQAQRRDDMNDEVPY